MIEFTDIQTTDSPNTGRTVINDNFDLIQNTYPLGKALSLNGTNQYAYHADSDSLDVGTEDFGIDFIFELSSLPASGGYFIILSKFLTNTGYYVGIYNNSGTYQLIIRLADGTNATYTHNFANLSINTIYHCSVIFDRSGYLYSFIHGAYNASSDISARAADASSAIQINIGASNTPSLYWPGKLDEIRLFRFGVNGLYVTNPTGGGTNLKIEVGASGGSLIWDDTNTSNLVKLMYQSPYESLTNLGYGGLEDADPVTNLLAGWNFTSGWGTTATGTIVDANTYSNTGGNGGVYKLTGLTVGKTYKCTLSFSTTATSVVVQATVISTTYATLSASGAFTFKATSTGISLRNTTDGTTDVTTLQIEEVGEVAHYKFNDDLTDETSNGLDLTGVNSPKFTFNEMRTLKSKSIFSEELLVSGTQYIDASSDSIGYRGLQFEDNINSHNWSMGLDSTNGDFHLDANVSSTWTNFITVDKGTGNVGIGTTSPAANLHVDQSSSSGAKPVLTLDQADVSEEFIRLIGTSTTDASQSLVDAANLTTPGSVVGWIKVYIQDDAASGAITDGVYYVPFYSAPTA